MSTSAQALTSVSMPIYLAIRVITDAAYQPVINLCAITYADEPSGWEREDYIQPESYFDQNVNEMQRHIWIYASAHFALAPYTRYMKVTIRCWDDPDSDTRLSIIAADEHKHLAESLVQEDIDHFIDMEIHKPDGQKPRLVHGMTGAAFRAGIQDPVTGRRFAWSLRELNTSSPGAHPVGRRTLQEEKKLERDRQQNVDPDEIGRVEEGKKERLELHGGLDLVKVDMRVKEEEVEIKAETRVKTGKVKTEVRVKMEEVKVEKTE
ncbi:hypothetical protein BKA58DRAFT_398018 [Alternaria rosae]|uniref:uncharacterized protein n=1 Tax=Alternaria rosae TaxID=1187941 RepID=UPI001E8CABA1|nr:uncharacterized protein BKA58DRAFT_398018 [Alternaria rosae]KAH6877925.1 hypothetical protein BKA58DRAFT_398018 [Alternaria rosae]